MRERWVLFLACQNSVCIRAICQSSTFPVTTDKILEELTSANEIHTGFLASARSGDAREAGSPSRCSVICRSAACRLQHLYRCGRSSTLRWSILLTIPPPPRHEYCHTTIYAQVEYGPSGLFRSTHESQ